MRRHPTATVNVARISVARSGIDFTAPERISQVGIAGIGTAPSSPWRKADIRGYCASAPFGLKGLNRSRGITACLGRPTRRVPKTCGATNFT